MEKEKKISALLTTVSNNNEKVKVEILWQH